MSRKQAAAPPENSTDTTALKAQIEIAERVLWETRNGGGWNWVRDYSWLQAERARLVRKLEAMEASASPGGSARDDGL